MSEHKGKCCGQCLWGDGIVDKCCCKALKQINKPKKGNKKMSNQKFIIKIDQTYTHTMTIEAENTDQAYTIARDILDNPRKYAVPLGYIFEPKEIIRYSIEAETK